MYSSILIYHLYEVAEVVGELFCGAWVFALEGGKGLLECLALWMVSSELGAKTDDLLSQLNALDEAFPSNRGTRTGIDEVGVAWAKKEESGVVEGIVRPVHPRPMEQSVEVIGNGIERKVEGFDGLTVGKRIGSAFGATSVDGGRFAFGLSFGKFFGCKVLTVGNAVVLKQWSKLGMVVAGKCHTQFGIGLLTDAPGIEHGGQGAFVHCYAGAIEPSTLPEVLGKGT